MHYKDFFNRIVPILLLFDILLFVSKQLNYYEALIVAFLSILVGICSDFDGIKEIFLGSKDFGIRVQKHDKGVWGTPNVSSENKDIKEIPIKMEGKY